MEDLLKTFIQLSFILIQTEISDPSIEDISNKVDGLLKSFTVLAPQRDKIIGEIRRRIHVRIGSQAIIHNDEGHIEWLEKTPKEDWRLWNRLKSYLNFEGEISRQVIDAIDHSTNLALSKFENPMREGAWDRRGLIVGQVQSGKTTHYTALASKAIDSGYKIVIILAGIHNNLRNQTQQRIDKDLVGRDSSLVFQLLKTNNGVEVPRQSGVADHANKNGLPNPQFGITTLTFADDKGDFSTKLAGAVHSVINEGNRLVLVIKKEKTILTNLKTWLDQQENKDMPALIIDDEADHSSIDTTNLAPETDPSTINGLIRKLIKTFTRVSFVGYTATPLANCNISTEEDSDEFGKDLFPESFIIYLPAPSNYIGSSRVFGRLADEEAGLEAIKPLPMHLDIVDSEEWMPPRHRTDHGSSGLLVLPESLKEAISVFIIGCAVRVERGHTKTKQHCSMLIHVTRLQEVQKRVRKDVRKEIDGLAETMKSGTTSMVRDLETKYKEIWAERFLKNHEEYLNDEELACDKLPKWKDVWRHVKDVLSSVDVMLMNGSSTDILPYFRAEKSKYIIAVGGDKLSRGLTLSGLSVSYFLRASNTWDTLMQMGRWFGYRPGYADLCKVYTPKDLLDEFKEMTLANDEYFAQIILMGQLEKTPKEFGLRMRFPTSHRLPAAANKIRRGTLIKVSYAGDFFEANEIEYKGSIEQDNINAVRSLIQTLGKGENTLRGKSCRHSIWKTDSNAILNLLGNYQANSDSAFKDKSLLLTNYIKKQVKLDELRDWTVVLMSGDGNRITIEGNVSTFVLRKLRTDVGTNVFAIGSSNKHKTLMGPLDISFDLSQEEFDRARELSRGINLTSNLPDFPSRNAVLEVRPVRRGLLSIYLVQKEPLNKESLLFCPLLAISFPTSSNAEPVDYLANSVWSEQNRLYKNILEESENNVQTA